MYVEADAAHATSTAEGETALTLIDRHKAPSRRITLCGDNIKDAAEFIGDLRKRKVAPRIAINGAVSMTGKIRSTAIDSRVTRHAGDEISQQRRRRIEEGFGWSKTVAGLRKVRLLGLAKIKGLFTFTIAACNLIRIPKLLAAQACAEAES